ncbi:hypothetical protein OIU76_027573 [Salix suchowensis]|nr:hypothetical protein OIU76_027573 [Salix suchowensis]
MSEPFYFFPEHAQESVRKLDRHSSGTLILDRNEYTLILQNKMSGNNKSYGISGAGTGKAPSSGGTGSGSSKGVGSMKAPGQDFRISRDGFEKNPAGYFSDLHKK